MEDEQKIGFFQEDKDSLSMMRLMAFSSFWVGILFSVAAVVLAAFSLTMAAQYALIFAFGFVGTAFGGKLFQKFAENDNFFLFKK